MYIYGIDKNVKLNYLNDKINMMILIYILMLEIIYVYFFLVG